MATEPSDPGRELRDRVKVWSSVGSGVDFEEDELTLMPTDALRLEHRVIERVMRILEARSMSINQGEGVDRVFAHRVVDFLSVYADRVHHGKEEEILFRELDDCALSAEHRRMMEELVREHVEMRRLTAELRSAVAGWPEGGEEALNKLSEPIGALTNTYPTHMRREEEEFFPVISSYLGQEDLLAVLDTMAAHDRAMIHEKYGGLADEWEGNLEQWDSVE